MWKLILVSLSAVCLGGAGTAGAQQQTVKAELPDSLARQAKITEPDARKIAAAKVPKGTITAVELEREHGHLQYSYDVSVPGQSGITEVNVDAVSGKVLGVQHEGAADEAKEAAAERKPKP